MISPTLSTPLVFSSAAFDSTLFSSVSSTQDVNEFLGEPNWFPQEPILLLNLGPPDHFGSPLIPTYNS